MRGMLIAALRSRSCYEPQLPQIQVRTDNGISSTSSPQSEHALDVAPMYFGDSLRASHPCLQVRHHWRQWIGAANS
jgi:hypothetical protein